MLVYKEPFLALAPEFLYRALPDARLLYIFRDGRDVADSLVRSYDVLSDQRLAGLETNEAPIGRKVGSLYVPWWITSRDERAFLQATPFGRAVFLWRAMAQRTRSFLETPLALESERILSVRYEDLAANPEAEAERIVAHLGQPLTRRVSNQFQTIHSKSIGIHLRRSDAEIREAAEIAGSELEAHGYAI